MFARSHFYTTIQNHTQALTEKCIVCLSQRKEVGVGAAVVDDPDVLVVDPTV